MAKSTLESSQRTEIRSDIQGIRAIAVVAVVVYHLWPNRLPGGFVGVDVFFVVSGFLITLHILKGLESQSRLSFLMDFYAKRVRRLAPAAVTVLLAVVAAIFLILPVSAWRTELGHVLASTFFFENWHLAGLSTDYLGAENAASPLQHYWSLSVEEQFYIVWPLVLMLALLLSRSRRQLILFLATFTLVSLVFCVWITATNPDLAYFATPARAWQFGVGALASFVVVRGRAWSLALPWGGAGMVAVSLFVIDSSTAYPGVWALLPTIGTGLMLLGREKESVVSFGSVSRVLPVRWLGDVSYSLYLWHWPLIVFVPIAIGSELTLPWKLVVLAASLVLAHLSFRWIETPFRTAKWVRPRIRTGIVGLTALALVVAPAAAGVFVADRATAAASQELKNEASQLESCFGGLAIDEPSCEPGLSISAETASAAKDDKPLPWIDDCADGLKEMSEVLCEYGDPNGEKKVLLWGDSHSGSWAPALDGAGKLGGFSVTVAMRHGCPSTLEAPIATSVGRTITETEQQNCQARNDWVLEELVPQYDQVVLANMTTNYSFAGDAVSAYADVVDAVSEAGPEVVWLQDVALTGDNQGNRVNGPDCLAANGNCSNPVDRALETGAIEAGVEQQAAGEYRYVQTSSRFCDDTECFFARGGVSVYFDASHLSNSYSASLAPWLLERLQPTK